MKHIVFFYSLVLSFPFCVYGSTGSNQFRTTLPESVFRDTVIETVTNYSNGTVQLRTISFIDQEGIRYKVVREGYRKNGSKKYVSILNSGVLLLYQARYDKNDQPIVEKTYYYNFRNTLVQIETKRDGISTFQTFDTDIYGD